MAAVTSGNEPSFPLLPSAASECWPSPSWSFFVPRPLLIPVSEMPQESMGRQPVYCRWPGLSDAGLGGGRKEGNGEQLCSQSFCPNRPFSPPLVQSRTSSYSGEYGGKGGSRFSHSGNQLDGPITAIRVRVNRYYIVG